MSERRYPVGMMVMVPIILAFGVYAFTGQQPVATPDASATPSLTEASEPDAATNTPPATATETAVSAPSSTSTPAQVSEHGAFHEGAWVRVNAGAGDCLNARLQPSTSGEYNRVSACLPDGYEGYLAGRSVQQDGHWWWTLAGYGWVAEDYLVYLRDVSLRDALAPRLAGQGRIAFLREADIWVMNADGSEQRLVAHGDVMEYPSGLAWSPDGTRLSYSTPHYAAGTGNGSMDLHVIDLSGAEVLSVGAAVGGGWSPDGARISIVRGATPPQMGGGWQGAPGWVEVASGAVHLLTEATFYQQDPPQWSPDGSHLLLTDEVYDSSSSQRAIRIVDLDGNDIARIDLPQDVYYMRPQWSPDGTRIAFVVSDGDNLRLATYDIAALGIAAEALVPERDPSIGGKCGSSDMWLVEWSRDGRQVLFSFGEGLTGTNGVWAWDPASGERRLVPAPGGGPPAAGPGGLFAFAPGGQFIFAGEGSGGMPVLITDGRAPIWSPD